MKTIFLSILTVVLLSCNSNKSGSANQRNDSVNINEKAAITAEFKIEGMTCTGCENTIKSNLSKIAGVVSVNASYTEGLAIVKFDTTKVTSLKIAAAIDDIGYKTVSYKNK